MPSTRRSGGTLTTTPVKAPTRTLRQSPVVSSPVVNNSSSSGGNNNLTSRSSDCSILSALSVLDPHVTGPDAFSQPLRPLSMRQQARTYGSSHIVDRFLDAVSVMRDSEALTTFRSSASSNSLQMTSRLSTSLDSGGGSPPTDSAVLDALNAELVAPPAATASSPPRRLQQFCRCQTKASTHS